MLAVLSEPARKSMDILVLVCFARHISLGGLGIKHVETTTSLPSIFRSLGASRAASSSRGLGLFPVSIPSGVLYSVRP